MWRARLLVLISLLGFIWGPFFAPVHFFLSGSWWAALALLVAGGGAACVPLVLRLTGSFVIAGNMLFGILYGIVFVVTAVRGGYPVSGLMWSIAIPMLAIFLFGRRTAAVWFGLVAVKYTVLGTLTYLDMGLPLRMTDDARLLLDILGLLSFLVLLTSIAMTYESQRRLALDRAEAAGRAKTDFLARMSHEIRTPMNGVIGMTSLLFDTDLTSRQDDYTRTIRQSGNALLHILNEILDFSKIEAGKLVLETNRFQLRQELDQLKALFSPQAAEKGLGLHIEVEPDVPRAVFGDAGRLRQILVNLIGNGLKFTDAGEVRVHVDVEPSQDGVFRLRFQVQDTGIGIAPEALSSILDPFTQAEESSSRRYEGTGLGLAICRQLSEVMDGSIGIESRLGEGSSFTVTVALAPAPPEPMIDQIEVDDASLHMGQGERILVAEDNPVNQQVTVFMLESLGYLADVVADGSEVLEALEQGHYDLVLMDCQMPVMDGYEATRRIRKAPDLECLPILAMTANALADDREKCLAVGMSGYLAKPVRTEELASALERCLSSNPRRSRASAY